MSATELLDKAYAAFNARNIDEVLSLMHADVAWPNGWEGGYVHGHAAVRAYWERQWAEIDPQVKPVRYTTLADDRTQVDVHQLVKDKEGAVLADGMIKHIYTIHNGLVRSMEIQAS